MIIPEPNEDDYKHWGMACYCFSLDLADGITMLAIPDVRPDVVRHACRESILSNRRHIKQTGRPSYLRNLVKQAWRGPGFTKFDTYVEHVFVSPARRSHLDFKLLRPLMDADRLAAVDKALELELEGKSYAASLYELIPEDAADKLFEAVMTIDSHVDGQELTPWDRDLVARNNEIHSSESPLALIIHTEIQQIQHAAACKLHDGLSASGQHALNNACEASPHG